MRAIVILLILFAIGCNKTEDIPVKPVTRKVSMELVRFAVEESEEAGSWQSMTTGERVNGPMYLLIHVIGKTSWYSPKDSIVVASEQVETTREPIMTPSYIPFGYTPQYKTITTKIPADIKEDFSTVCFPKTMKPQLELRLDKALLNKEWVTFILKTENKYEGERCYGIEFSKTRPK